VLRAGPGRDPHVPYAPHCVRRPIAPTACKQALSLWDARRPDPRAGTTSKSAKGGRELWLTAVRPHGVPRGPAAHRQRTGSSPLPDFDRLRFHRRPRSWQQSCQILGQSHRGQTQASAPESRV